MKSDYIFFNCPFDELYFSKLRAGLFAVIYLGKIPLIAETKDSSKNRLEQITSLMEQAKYSIHDLSRVKCRNPRFNIPFELGIDFGLKRSAEHKDKQILVLEGKQYSLKSIISDIAGNDTKYHNNRTAEMIKCIRDWFFSAIAKTDISYTEIWKDYNEFSIQFSKKLANKGIQALLKDTIPISELIDNMKKWIDNLKK